MEEIVHVGPRASETALSCRFAGADLPHGEHRGSRTGLQRRCGDARTLSRARRGRRAMTRPAITFGWQINIGHILVAVSTLTAGVAAYTDLRHDVTDQIRINAVQAARLEAL